MVAYYKESNVNLLRLARVLLVVLALVLLAASLFAAAVVAWLAS